jgi:hypothetical protein
MSKATMATIKSFIRKNGDNLLISVKSQFDGMVDGVRACEDKSFTPVIKTDAHVQNTLGIQGAWVVGGSRDYIKPLEIEGLTGFRIYNCCGSFEIAVAV